jgi:type IV pilus assembly protein PilV
MKLMTPPVRRQRGMTLIEVLVAILIFSFGLVGLVALQARALHYSTSAEDQNRAALLANELTSTMTVSQTVSLPASAVDAWKARIADPTTAGLPSGLGNVDVDATTGLATITITWQPPNAASGSVLAQNKYVTQFKVVN